MTEQLGVMQRDLQAVQSERDDLRRKLQAAQEPAPPPPLATVAAAIGVATPELAAALTQVREALGAHTQAMARTPPREVPNTATHVGELPPPMPAHGYARQEQEADRQAATPLPSLNLPLRTGLPRPALPSHAGFKTNVRTPEPFSDDCIRKERPADIFLADYELAMSGCRNDPVRFFQLYLKGALRDVWWEHWKALLPAGTRQRPELG
jgi:hypothetical protein